MKQLLLLMLILVLCLHAAYAEEPETPQELQVQKSTEAKQVTQAVSLRDCIENALANHPNLVTARANIKKTHAQLGQTLSSYYPQVSYSSTFSRSGVWDDSDKASQSQYANSLSLSQYITDFGKSAALVRASRENVLMSLCDLKSAENDIIYNVKTAYYQYLASASMQHVNQDSVELYKLHLEQSRAFYSVGTQSKIEVTTSEVALSNALYNLSKASTDYKTSRLNLFYAMGDDTGSQLELESKVDFPEVTGSLDQFLDLAENNRPDVLKYEAQERAARDSLTAAKAGLAPSLSSFLRYGGNYEHYDYKVDNTWNVGVSLNLSITDGNYTVNRIREANANLEAIQAQNTRTWQSISLDVKTAYLSIGDLKYQLDLSATTLRQAEENFHLADSRYKVGVGSNIEFMDAKNSLLNAQASNISVMAQYLTAVANLEHSVGVRIDSLLKYDTGAVSL